MNYNTEDMVKRIYLSLFIILSLHLPLFAAKEIGYASIDNFSYVLYDNGTASVAGFALRDELLDSIAIPTTISYNGHTYTVTEINDGVFYNTSIKSVKFPQYLEIIGDRAFKGCKNLTTIEFPESLSYIGVYAFQDCFLLGLGKQKLVIPDNIRYIGKGAFPYNDYSEIWLSDNVTKLYSEAFAGSHDLEKLAIGRNTNTIESGCFAWCGVLKRVACRNTTPPDFVLPDNAEPGSEILTFTENDFKYACLIVPKGSKSAYENHPVWGKFEWIEEMYTSLTFNPSSIEGGYEDEGFLSKFIDEDIPDEALICESSNSSIVSVDNYDHYKFGHVSGRATVTARLSRLYSNEVVSAKCYFVLKGDKVESISFTKPDVELRIGESKQLDLLIMPWWLENPKVQWSVSEWYLDLLEQGADYGVVKGKRAGKTQIRVSGEGYSSYKQAYCNVTIVEPDVEVVEFNEHSKTVIAGEKFYLPMSLVPEFTPLSLLQWKSSDNRVIVIAEDGELTAVGLGKAIITATSTSGLRDECVVEVVGAVVDKPVEKVKLSKNSLLIEDKVSSYRINAAIYPTDASNNSLQWVSSSPDVVDVNNSGLLAIKRVGNALVKAVSSSGAADSCMVEVRYGFEIKLDSIGIAPEYRLANLDSFATLKPIFYPDSCVCNVKWSIDNKFADYGSVDETGTVRSTSSMWVEIPVSVEARGRTDKADVMFVKWIPADSVFLNKEVITLHVGESLEVLPARTVPVDCPGHVLTFDVDKFDEYEGRGFYWRSSDSKVASFNSQGKLLGREVGKMKIYAVSAMGIDWQDVEVVEGEIEQPDKPVIGWNQKIECAVGDEIELTATVTGNPEVLSYRCIVPNGGFQTCELKEDNGKWIASFANSGTHIIEAFVESNPEIICRKTFNVVPTAEGLMYENGLYYRYTDSSQSALQVVYGYKTYEGDWFIPARALGKPVRNIGDWAFYSCESLGKVNIAEGVERLGTQAFGNGTLSSVSLPASLIDIPDYTFNALKGDLTGIYLYATEPPKVNEAIFNGYVDYSTCTLHVPSGTILAYRMAEVWKEFANILDDLKEYSFVETIVLANESIELMVGDKAEIQYLISPSSATYPFVSWQCDSPDVASVENGVVTALNKGETAITVEAVDGSDVKSVCGITVYDAAGIKSAVDGDIEVYASNGIVTVKNVAEGTSIKIFMADGSEIVNIRANEIPMTVPVYAKGVCIVLVDGRPFKVVMK